MDLKHVAHLLHAGKHLAEHLLKCRDCGSICDPTEMIGSALWTTNCCQVKLCDSCVRKWKEQSRNNGMKCVRCGRQLSS